jgi:phosphoenolpyruvate synthase/pyruvate phosphate dikinase
MVRSDLGAAGVMFTIDTESGFRDAVLINASYGLGENVVQGSVNPDEYVVFKPTLLAGARPIVQKSLGTKEWKLVYDIGGSKMTKNVPVAPADRAGSRSATTTSSPSRAGAASSRITIAPGSGTTARWTSSGPRTA